MEKILTLSLSRSEFVSFSSLPAIHGTYEVVCSLNRSRFFASINGPFTCNARITPNGSSRSNGVEVFVSRNSQVRCFSAIVCDVTGSVNACEDDFCIHRGVDVSFPEVGFAFYSSHAYAGPSSILHIAISKSVNTNSCTVCFPPVLSCLAVNCLNRRNGLTTFAAFVQNEEGQSLVFDVAVNRSVATEILAVVNTDITACSIVEQVTALCINGEHIVLVRADTYAIVGRDTIERLITSIESNVSAVLGHCPKDVGCISGNRIVSHCNFCSYRSFA